MTVRTLIGDCRVILPTLASGSVQCVVTSPPYYALRDYGVCGQLGLEPTLEAYLERMVAVFRHIGRVLRDDGTCWVNMGDSYAQTGGQMQQTERELATEIAKGRQGDERGRYPSRMTPSGRAANTAVGGYKPKDLLMMPARLAIALQADGWWLRSDIIWAKPNPMPESVQDRPTNAHEHVFLLTKRARYYFDNDAIREPIEEPWRSTGRLEQHGTKDVDAGANKGFGLDGVRPRIYNPAGRSCRNVWTIATHAFSRAHFATFPPALVERCIRAGTSERGCCAACGKAWVRVTDAKRYGSWKSDSGRGDGRVADQDAGLRGEDFYRQYAAPTTTGWAPQCQCDADTKPCTVLDPFGGAGTTGLVADRLQRDAVMIELNPSYVALAEARVEQDAGMFSSVVQDQGDTLRSPATPPLNGTNDTTLLDLIERATASSAMVQCDAR